MRFITSPGEGKPPVEGERTVWGKREGAASKVLTNWRGDVVDEWQEDRNETETKSYSFASFRLGNAISAVNKKKKKAAKNRCF